MMQDASLDINSTLEKDFLIESQVLRSRLKRQVACLQASDHKPEVWNGTPADTGDMANNESKKKD